ncbi:MAG: hypothetical protein JXA90_16370 [Planctomycetes bacterium]|nr:hypothetical protein [Planctomycetota bacterium]
MRWTIATLLAPALIAPAFTGWSSTRSASGEVSGVSVRVESTPGGPQISVDGKLVPPRMLFGSERPGLVRAIPEWSRQSFEFIPSEDAPGNGTLHFRFGHAPGEVWITDLRLTDADGDDVLPRGTFATPEAFAATWNVFPSGDANTVGAVDVADAALHVTLRSPPSGVWPDFHLHTRLVLELQSRRAYRCSFRVKAAPGRRISPAVYRVAGGVWHPVGGPPGPFLEQVRCARDAGVRFVSFSAPSPWAAPGSPPDWGPLDRLCRSIIDAHPSVLLLPRVGCDAPARWLERHPDARMVYEGGRPGTHASVSDRTYRADAAENLENLCRHLAEAFPDHLAGVHPCGQNTGEWFYEATWEPRLSGYDRATLAAFRAWLRSRGDARADAASVPAPEDRHGAPSGLLRDPARERRLVDFALFQQDEMADMVTTLAAAARRGLGPRKLVVFFYGYHYEFGSVRNGAPTSGHYALERVLSSPDIDVLCSPISYGDRGWKGTAPSMTSAESVRLAGKLWLNEDDTRTYLSGTTEYGGLADLAQTRSVMRRNTAQAAIRGFGTWWMDLPAEGWFADPRIWDEMRLLRLVDEAMLRRRGPFEPEIAAIVDEASVCHLAGGAHIAAGPLIYEGRQALGRVGAPYGQYLLRDAIAGRAPAKLQVFLAAWALGPGSRRALAEARRKDEVRAWVWAPGWILSGRADPAAMEDVCGFLCRPVSPARAVATPTPAGARLGLRSPWGVDAKVRPLFAADASPEETLAVWPDGSAAVALRATERGADAFVGTPRLTPELLRALARVAKVHLYTEVDASVWAAEGYISIHALADGPLEISTGKEGPVTDALTGEEVGRGPRLKLSIRAGETRVLHAAGGEPAAGGSKRTAR